jgi:2-keto-4-pentenoate hydratase
MTPAQIEQRAASLVDARRRGATRAPITGVVDLSLDDAYAIQAAVTATRVGRGEQVVGWKLGYTSMAMRAQMGIDAPNFGPLTDAMIVPGGACVSTALIQPRVEPEIGLRFGTPLERDVAVEDVLAAVDEALACLEVVDSVFADYRFRIEDNTADGSSAAQVVVGPRIDSDALEQVAVALWHNDRHVADATGAAASGHPAAGVVWLVAQLAARGTRLEAGQIVITGGLTAAVPLQPGDVVRAVFDGGTSVEVRRAVQ